MINQRIALPLEAIAEFCQRHHIRRLSLFGSVLRDDFRPDSDIDVLVEFEADAKVSLLDMGGMQVELTELLGREVDFKTEGFISDRILRRVMDSAVAIYERG
ncbi:MAG: nucleotidyltransferase family protein [Anaerolineae bacterium]|nr:nucleotidyltransferase family protein [Anaerolineae bacterium]